MTIEEICLRSPHPDIDLGVARDGLRYLLARPAKGIGESTGLIVYIGGYGSSYKEEYAVKTLQYFADTYDCLAVSVDHFDACAKRGFNMRPANDFFEKLRQTYGYSVSAPPGADINRVLIEVLKGLRDKGISKLDLPCHLVAIHPNYMSFGVMPALDVLSVVHHVLANFSLDKRRIFVLGTSYGGYIASLIGKFAPNSFRLIIDNSGFSGADDDILSVYGYSGTVIEGVSLITKAERAFTTLRDAPNWLSPERMCLRDLTCPDHYALPSETRFLAYHSAEDTVAPTARKIALAEMLAARRRYDLTLIRETDIDGRIFKTAAHGMSASMRGLFELSYRRWQDEAAPAAAVTDFDLGTVVILPCGARDCVVRFSPAGVRLTMRG